MNTTSPKNKAILILTSAYHPLIGGSEIAIDNVIRRLPSYDVTIVTPRYSADHARYEQNDTYKIVRVGPIGSMSKWLFPLTGFFAVRSLLRQKQYDALHVWQASFAGGVAWLLKLFGTRIPLLLTLQEGKALDQQSWFKRAQRQRIIKAADHITAISTYLKKYAQRYTQKPITIIPNGIALDRFNKQSTEQQKSLQEKYNINEKTKTILTVSRLVHKNAVDDIIAAMPQLDDTTHLYIAGTGPLEQSLRKQADTLGVTKRVHFLGDIPNEQIPAYLSIADVFVRPSRSEGQGISFIEAMAARVPIVATNVGGIADFLQDGTTGYVCNVDDPASVAKALQRALHDTQKDVVTQNAYQLVVDRYDWGTIAQQYQTVYENTFSN